MAHRSGIPLSPAFSALMCDGMGWFVPLDYKRALLLYDNVSYLFPGASREFLDESGKRRSMFFPLLQDGVKRSFTIEQYPLMEPARETIMEAARGDAADPEFTRIVAEIPRGDRLYTWRVVNSDGDLWPEGSAGLRPGEEAMAHAILLNKFLLASDKLDTTPITGKPYIHEMLLLKRRAAAEAIRKLGLEADGDGEAIQAVKFGLVSHRILSALIPDEDLQVRTEQEILVFKQENRDLFLDFSLYTRQILDGIRDLPFTKSFEREIQDLLNTRVWKEKVEVERLLREAWTSLFKRTAEAGLAGLVGVGITPLLSLGAVSLATVASSAAAVAPWALSELMRFLEARKQARRHGLYYLLNFAREG